MKAKQKHSVSEQLRAAVEAGPLSRYEICKQTGLDQGLLCRFVHGESGLSFRSIDLLCELLGLELRPVKPKQVTPKPTKRPMRKRTAKKGGK